MAGYHQHRDMDLSTREREVLELMAKGLTNGQIATHLDIAFDTAKSHVSAIISKLGVETREEAVRTWKDRQRLLNRFSRMARGMVAGIGLWKVAAGSVGVVAVGAIGVFLVASMASSLDAGSPSRSGADSRRHATIEIEEGVTLGLPGLLPESVAEIARCSPDSREVYGVASVPADGGGLLFAVASGADWYCVSVLQNADRRWIKIGGSGVGGATALHSFRDAPECGDSIHLSSEPGHTYCIVRSDVAYAEVDDGTLETVSAVPLPPGLRMDGALVAATHTAQLHEDWSMVLRFFTADGTLVDSTTRPLYPALAE